MGRRCERRDTIDNSQSHLDDLNITPSFPVHVASSYELSLI